MSDQTHSTFFQQALATRNFVLNEQLPESQIHRNFVDKLIGLASKRINRRFHTKIAPEDVVQSVFASFFKRQRDGEFEYENWNDLWALLVKITINKCINKINKFKTAKRDIDREKPRLEASGGDSYFGKSQEASAHEIAIFNESLDNLFDRLPDSLRQLVCLRLQGMSNFEISEELDCSERTVYRNLKRVREIFLEFEKSEP